MRSKLYEGKNLRPGARTLWEIQAWALRPPVETATNLYISARDRASACVESSFAAREAITDEHSLRARQAAVKEAFLRCIGGLPCEPSFVSAEVTSRTERGSFIAENTVLETRPGYYATCTVYLPKGFDSPRPAVLLLIGHTDEGKADPEYQYVSQLFVNAGFIVLALDPFGEGERFEHYDLPNDFQPIQGCSGEHDLMDWKFKLMGVSLARYFVSDALAALKYLKSRPDVDASRVGLTGHSGGGTQVSMLMLAAADEFACAAPCAYISDTKAMIDEGVDPDNEMIWPGSLQAGIDYADILLSMAPRPVTVLSNRHDFFPREGALRACAEARNVWERLDLPDPPELVCSESEHAYGETLAQAALRAFSRALLGKEITQECEKRFSFEPLAREELFAAKGCILKYKPHIRTLQREANELLARLRQRPRVSGNELSDKAFRLIDGGRIRPGEIRVYKEGICAPYAYFCIVFRSEPGIWLNAVLLRDMRLEDGPLPTNVMFWPGGVARIAEHSNLIHKTVSGGKQALILDLPGEGALLPAKLGGTDMYISWSTMYKLNSYLIQLGDSLAALRTRGVAAACEALKTSRMTSEDICLYSEGDMDKYAMIAALLCGVKAALSGNCQSYEEIVAGEFHDQTHTHAWALPGALEAFDSEDILCELKRRALLQ
ncbi:MAG: prolyl oligopeptidase family serine peptidase [Clostridiales bacterium]|nr:prolyl oligopeptidase family serine peptidase [Clostridiales bacterium]